ncbi:hypothetical protein SDC9_147270 [bioreactor metagenome]|uniref:Uncharacterized protein n=1 Tax=bioreactor metagenome TaxID=1076179 RepID=A0A645EF84_9ZZZZ
MEVEVHREDRHHHGGPGEHQLTVELLDDQDGERQERKPSDDLEEERIHVAVFHERQHQTHDNVDHRHGEGPPVEGSPHIGKGAVERE